MFAALTIETGADLAVAIASTLVALGIIWRYLIRPVRDAFHRVETSVVFVEAELKPNGGSSLRDAVNRIESKVDNHEGRLIALEHALSNLEAKLREPVVSSTTTTTKVKTVEPAHIEETA
jgi:hypothetical protein